MEPGGDEASRSLHRYYDRIDAADYDGLRELLHPEFTQYRPDRTLDGRDRFVRFMREDRPRTATIHELRDVFHRSPADDDEPLTLAARGTLRDEAGDRLFGFVDIHAFDETGRIRTLWTYTR